MGESKPKSEQEGISREALLFRAKNFARSNGGEAVPIESLSYKEFAGAEQVLKDFEDPQSPEARQLADFIETSKKIDAGIFEKIQDEVIYLNTQIRTENFRPLSERMCQQLEERLVEMSPDMWEAVSAVIEKSREKNEEQKFEDERRRAKREIQTGIVNSDMETVNEIMLAMKGDMATHFPDREIPTLSEAQRSDLFGRIQELGLKISPEQEYFLKNGKLMEERKPQNAGFWDINQQELSHAAIAARAAMEAKQRSDALEDARNIPTQIVTPPQQKGFWGGLKDKLFG